MKIVVDERPLPADCETMLDVRKGVDALDRALVLMLAERQRYMDAAARIKSERHTVLDTARIEDISPLLDRLLDPDFRHDGTRAGDQP